MKNVTIQVSPIKIALVVAGVAALVLGGLAQFICIFNPPIDTSFIHFLMLGSHSLYLRDLQPFVYFWFGLGTLLILVGLFAKLLPNEEQLAKQSEYRKKLINSLNLGNPQPVRSEPARPKTKLNTFTVLIIISIVVIPFIVLTLNF
jgi:hypothetical protein